MDAALLDQAVDNLVSQFSSSLDFYRELVQNSIDAGSTSVDVWLEWIAPTEGAAAAIVAHVDDTGEGMTEAIIDDQLTSLYSSSKEGDLTKIGKFGIGFVSVFAPKPAAVVVHTGRDGEYWEVFFHPDRSFTKTRIDGPIEGTRITMVLPGDRAAYDEFVARSRATLRRWCTHSEIEITFHDRSPIDGVDRGTQAVRSPFAVPGDCMVQVEHEQTTIVMAYDARPEYGFFNRGLALLVTRTPQDVLERRTARYARIGFKVKSRWLEHTLSRETVMHDANLERTLAFLDAAADGPLRKALVARLEELAAMPRWGVVEHEAYLRLIAHLAAEPLEGLMAIANARVLRTVERTATSLAELERQDGGNVYVAPRSSELTAALAGIGVPVLLGPRAGPRDGKPPTDPVRLVVVAYLAAADDRRLLSRLKAVLWESGDTRTLVGQRIVHPDDTFVAVTVHDPVDPEFTAMARAASWLLDELGHGYAQIRLGAIDGTDHQLHLCAIGRELARLMPVPAGQYKRRKRETPSVVLHHEHPHLLALRRLFRRHPRHGAYAFAKSLLLAEDQMLEHDARLVALARTLPIEGAA